jgi:hypothetical protein
MFQWRAKQSHLQVKSGCSFDTSHPGRLESITLPEGSTKIDEISACVDLKEAVCVCVCVDIMAACHVMDM